MGILNNTGFTTMDIINELFERLHQSPELSMCEKNTKRILIDFLRTNTDLETVDMGAWFYALKYSGDSCENIAFRADMDAILSQNGAPFHGCGHDGHCTVLCKLAHDISKQKIEKNIYFIFQPAEENGQGAKLIASHLTKLNISRIYGFHNLPGMELGTVLLKSGTFACASMGLTMRFNGKQSHAAYPEYGINPSFAISKLISNWENITDASKYKAPVLATIVNITVGEHNAFGVNAGNGNLSLTIRGELESDLKALLNNIIDLAQTICNDDGIAFSYEIFDEFPETFNNQLEVKRAAKILAEKGIPFTELQNPMRWSEDFGHYLKHVNGMFFGIGAGIDHPALHTPNYCFNRDITDIAAYVFKLLI